MEESKELKEKQVLTYVCLPERYKKRAREIINSIDEQLKAASNKGGCYTSEHLEARRDNNYCDILNVVDRLRRE